MQRGCVCTDMRRGDDGGCLNAYALHFVNISESGISEMKRTVIGLAAGLGAFCFLLIVIIIVMCVIRVKR